jgi:hypothetical protein
VDNYVLMHNANGHGKFGNFFYWFLMCVV